MTAWALAFGYSVAAFAVSGWRGAVGSLVVIGLIASARLHEKPVDRSTAFLLDAVYFGVAVVPFFLTK